MGLLDRLGSITRGVQSVVSELTGSKIKSQLEETIRNIENLETGTVLCDHFYGVVEPNTELISPVSQFNDEIKSNFYRDFFFIELKPVKLRKKQGCNVPHFVFETEDASSEFSKFLQEAFISLATETSDSLSFDVVQRWTSCAFSGPFYFMLDNVSQDFSHTNEYGLSFLSNLHNMLSQTAGQLIQLFYQQQALDVSNKAVDFLFNQIRPFLETISNQTGLPVENLAKTYSQLLKVMASGGRFDSPKVWNASSSQFNLTGTINLIADLTSPETIAIKIVEPLLILWALSIPRSFENAIDASKYGQLAQIAKYFYVWPYYVEATLYRGHPKYDHVKILRLPAAAIQGIKTSFSQENARYRGEAILGLKITFELVPVYNVVYGTLDTSSAMMTLGWFIKDSLANLIKLKRFPLKC